MYSTRVLLAVALLVAVPCAAACQAAEVWTGPKITFEKQAFGDWMLPANQDRITDNVWITRGFSAGLFNARTESGYDFDYSPDDTEWAYGTTADIGSLTFQDWRSAVGTKPPESVGLDMVLHLISDDIYIDIKFLQWGEFPSAGGYFLYERSTQVPEPSTLGLALLGLLGMMRASASLGTVANNATHFLSRSRVT